ncbi:radical SAM protein [candidate division CSSED10-310 bacterium]|uniref:Radical SAM protein n=1 Tax=candidate division CSSED10-310 bacterium TaxID=2855610 RepID=A0ABV6YXR6_UNCC1
MQKGGGKMAGMPVDISRLFVMLLEQCNFSCGHCAWKDGRLEGQPATHPGYKVSYAQMRTCLTEVQELQCVQRIHFSGGETTLWKDANKDFVDLLIEVAAAGFEPSFITNGSSFGRYDKCQEFLERYLSGSNRTLHISHSLDTFHGNFHARKGRAKSLDNLIRFGKGQRAEKQDLLHMEVNACISKDPDSLLPKDMIEYYRSQGIGFLFCPVRPSGKAKSISHLCPNTDSDTPEELGAFYPFLQQYKDYMKSWSRCVSLYGEKYQFPDGKVAKLRELREFLVDSQSPTSTPA